MRCIAYCTAAKYDVTSIAYYFQGQHYQVRFYRDVLHISRPGEKGDVFCFPSGCFVCWGLRNKKEEEIRLQIHQYAQESINFIEKDQFIFNYGQRTDLKSHERYNVDIITLEDDDVKIKLAISYGLAQSVKLEAFEEQILNTIYKNQSLASTLAKKGRITLSSKNISQRMGEILSARSMVNLGSEYLDMPEYFWKLPSLEHYYLKTATFLELNNRVSSLNKRLDALKEILEMLNGQLQHRHSSLLEIIIIALIFIEILLTLIHWT